MAHTCYVCTHLYDIILFSRLKLPSPASNMIRERASFVECLDCLQLYHNEHQIEMVKQPSGLDVIMCLSCGDQKTTRLDNKDYDITVLRKGKRKWETACMKDIECLFDDEDYYSETDGDIEHLKIVDTKSGKVQKLNLREQFFEDSYEWFPYVPKESFLETEIKKHKRIAEDLEKWYEDLYGKKYVAKKIKVESSDTTKDVQE